MKNWHSHWIIPLIFIVVGILFIFFFPIFYVNVLCQKFPSLNFEPYGTIGDTMGGITGPFINLFGAILVYLALKAQTDANQKNEDQHFFNYMVTQINRFEDLYINSTIDLNEVYKSIESAHIQQKPIVGPLNVKGEQKEFPSFACQTNFSNSDLQKVILVLTSALTLHAELKKFTYKSRSEVSLLLRFISLNKIIRIEALSDIISLLENWDVNNHYSPQNDLIKEILSIDKLIKKNYEFLSEIIKKTTRLHPFYI